jgi:acetylornithine deacetylase/succinyl-diaminopimelate desuccinylase-like protein
MSRSCFFLYTFLYMAAVNGQSEQTLKIRSIQKAEQKKWMDEYMSFLAIPNIASDTFHIRKNALYLEDMMRRRGISNVQLLQPDTKTAPPAVYGEIITPGAKQTLIFYAHYDGQPVDSTQWIKELHPFKPMMGYGQPGAWSFESFKSGMNLDQHDWRVFGRGASDDKGGVMAILSAYEVAVKSGLPIKYNIKFFFEGEEEAGSTHLHEIFTKYRSLLQSDLWIICDGPVHQSGKKMVSFGVRGDVNMGLTVYGPYRPLHSGHYGNWAPNPGMMLAKLLASMKDEKGRVTVKGFYDDVIPLTSEEKKALASIPSVGVQMKEELKFINEEMPGVSLNEAIMMPSLNINGMQSGNIGAKAANVIPVSASAVLDLRLVPGNDPLKQQQKVMAHIRSQGYYVTEKEPTDAERKKYEKIAMVKPGTGYSAQRTAINLPAVQKVIAAVKSTTPDQVILVPSMGGSLPLFIFERYLEAKTITVPIANHDNNQHAENENIRLKNLWSGVETMAAIMLMQ